MPLKSTTQNNLLRFSFYVRLCLTIILTVTIVAAILQWILFPTEITGGATQLVNSSLIRQGLVIYRDFWCKETPFVFYLHSWAFGILGESVIASKVIGIVIYICLLACLYYYYRGYKHHAWQTVVFLVALSGYFLLFNLTKTKWIAYAISFLALAIYLISCQAKRNKESKADLFLVCSGIAAGLAILAKLNCGAYLFLGICCGLASDWLFERDKKYHLQRLAYFILPVITCLGLYLIAHIGHLPALIDQVIVFPGEELGQHRIISLANKDDLWHQLLPDFGAVYLTVTFPLIWFHLRLVKLDRRISKKALMPLYIAIAIAPLLFIAEFQTPALLPKLFIYPFLGVIACQLWVKAIATQQFAILCTYALYLHYYLSRADSSHYSPLFFFILVLAIDELFNYRQFKLPKVYFYSLLCLLIYQQFSVPWDTIKAKFGDRQNLINAVRVIQLKDTLLARGDSPFLMSANLPLTKPEAKIYNDGDELVALQFVHQNTTADDYVYVGVTDHARVYVANVRSYWALGRQIGVSNYTLEPGLTTEKSVQAEMIAELKQNQVNWIVLWQQPKPEADFRARNYQGSQLLDRYIQQNYSQVKQVGDYFIYRQSV